MSLHLRRLVYILTLALCAWTAVPATANDGSKPDNPAAVTAARKYDLPGAASLRVYEGKVGSRETFSSILLRYNARPEEVAGLIEAAAEVYPTRRITRGKKYAVFYDETPLKRARYLVIEPDFKRYVVYHLDPVKVELHERPVVVERQVVAATVRGPIYGSLDAQGIPRTLVPELDEIFEGQVDVRKLRKGSQVKVVFEAETIGGQVVRPGKILGARIQEGSKLYQAVYFEEDGQGGYYDENGHSRRTEFINAPVQYTRISSSFASVRLHPVQKVRKPHLGTDFVAPEGTPIHAVADGIVLEAARKRNNGNYVKLRHDATYDTGYLHMSRIASGIRPGAKVRQGDVIGYVGSTGLATGAHLCFRFWKNGVQVDPRKEVMPGASPVRRESEAAFESRRKEVLRLLDEARPQPARRNAAA